MPIRACSCSLARLCAGLGTASWACFPQLIPTADGSPPRRLLKYTTPLSNRLGPRQAFNTGGWGRAPSRCRILCRSTPAPPHSAAASQRCPSPGRWRPAQCCHPVAALQVGACLPRSCTAEVLEATSLSHAGFSLSARCTSEGVPFASCFANHVQWVATPQGTHSCRLVITGEACRACRRAQQILFGVITWSGSVARALECAERLSALQLSAPHSLLPRFLCRRVPLPLPGVGPAQGPN